MNESTFELIDILDNYTGEVTGQAIKKTDPDGSVWFVPMDEANTDYQEYLRSLTKAEENKEN